jgi:dihydroneopterin aldolase
MDQILLENMEFYAYHGHFAEEQKTGNRFRVDIQIEADLSKPAGTDDLDDTIDYARVYALVNKEMGIPSKLLEHVAGRIADSLKNHFQGMKQVSVKVSKLNPNMGGRMEGVSVMITR